MQLTDDRSCVDFSTSHKQPLKGVVGEVDQMLANWNAAAGFSENSRDRDQEGSDSKGNELDSSVNHHVAMNLFSLERNLCSREPAIGARESSSSARIFETRRKWRPPRLRNVNSIINHVKVWECCESLVKLVLNQPTSATLGARNS